MEVDKAAKCPTEGLNQKFRLDRDERGRTTVIVSDSLTAEDISLQILSKISVDSLCEKIFQGADNAEESISFAERIELFADHYAKDEKISSESRFSSVNQLSN